VEELKLVEVVTLVSILGGAALAIGAWKAGSERNREDLKAIRTDIQKESEHVRAFMADEADARRTLYEKINKLPCNEHTAEIAGIKGRMRGRQNHLEERED
jgi:uncharacterized damage-inducible protein DinB